MKGSINNISVIGTGVIGAGWIIRFLYNQKKINVYDPEIKQRKFLFSKPSIAPRGVERFSHQHVAPTSLDGCDAAPLCDFALGCSERVGAWGAREVVLIS